LIEKSFVEAHVFEAEVVLAIAEESFKNIVSIILLYLLSFLLHINELFFSVYNFVWVIDHPLAALLNIILLIKPFIHIVDYEE